MDKNQLLSMMQTTKAIENDLTEQIMNQRESLEEKRNKLNEEIVSFLDEAFPKEIMDFWKEVGQYDCNFYYVPGKGHMIIYKHSTKNGATIECLVGGYSYTIGKEYLVKELPENVDEYGYYAERLKDRREALEMAKEYLPSFYQELANRKQEKIDEKKKKLESCINCVPDESKRKYKIIIEVEE